MEIKINNKKCRKIILSLIFLEALIFFLALLPMINAELPQAVEKGNCVNIKIPYNATWINISSITYPNQTMISLNTNTSLIGLTFFYNAFCDTNDLGTYTYEFFASDGFASGNSFKVTENGDEIETSTSMMYIFLVILILLFLGLFIYLSFIIPYENKKENDGREIVVVKVTKSKYIKLICIWISYGLFLWFITMISGIVNNYIAYQILKDFTMNLYLFFSTLGYAVSTIMVWFLFLNVWKDIVLNRIILKEGKAFINNL